MDTAAVFYVNRNGKPCFERRLKNCCTGWTDDYREGIVAVEVVEEKILFAKKYKLEVKSSDGWPPYRVNKFPIMKEADMRAFADACNAWIEKVSGNASIPIANVVVQQPIATEVDVSRAKNTNAAAFNILGKPQEASAPVACPPPSYAEALLEGPSKV